MKTRVNSFDIAPLAVHLHSRLAGSRLINVYHSTARTYLFKFLAKAGVDATEDERKPVLIVDNSIRLHLTKFEWPKSPLPNSFVVKLRKHLRSARVERVFQVGADRIVDIVFSNAQGRFHLLLQFFGRGNILLTDENMKVLAALRTSRKIISVNDTWTARGLRDKFVTELDEDALEAAFAKAEPKNPYRSIAAKTTDLPAIIINAALANAGLKHNVKVGTAALQRGTDTWDAFVSYVRRALATVSEERDRLAGHLLRDAEALPDINGYIYRDAKGDVADVLPCRLPALDEGRELPWGEPEVVPSHNDAMDKVFREAEDKRRVVVASAVANRSGSSRLDRLREKLEERLDSLQEAENVALLHAAAIEMSMHVVERVLKELVDVVDEATPLGVASELARRRERGDALGMLVSGFDPAEQTFSLALPKPPVDADGAPTMEWPDEDDAAAADQEFMLVELDLHETVFGNLSAYYNSANESRAKRLKTESQSALAVRNVTHSIKEDAARAGPAARAGATDPRLRERRRPLWFEKFYWFISSDNYLVICGRDAISNETLVRQHLAANDVWVHADIHGAATTIVKNMPPHEIFALAGREPPAGASRLAKRPIPDRTIEEAVEFAVAHSRAWQEGFVARAYWVWGDQVSKIAPSGQFLPQGSFVVRGERNYLPRIMPNMGFALAFRLGEDSRAAHAGERRAHAGTQEDEAAALAALEAESSQRAAIGERQRRHALGRVLREFNLTRETYDSLLKFIEGEAGSSAVAKVDDESEIAIDEARDLVRAVRRRVADILRTGDEIEEEKPEPAGELEQLDEDEAGAEAEAEAEAKPAKAEAKAATKAAAPSGSGRVSKAVRRAAKRLQEANPELSQDEALDQARAQVAERASQRQPDTPTQKERAAAAAAAAAATSTATTPVPGGPKLSKQLSHKQQRQQRAAARRELKFERDALLSRVRAARAAVASSLSMEGAVLTSEAAADAATELSFAITTYGGGEAADERRVCARGGAHLAACASGAGTMSVGDVADLADFEVEGPAPIFCSVCGAVGDHESAQCADAQAILTRRKAHGDAEERLIAELEAEVGIVDEAAEAAAAAAADGLVSSGASLLQLTGRPKAGDTVLSVIPFTAPWSALQANKFVYKVRMAPGDLKRGRGAQLARAIFTSPHFERASALAEHKLLVREIPETEMVLQILPDVQFSGQAAAREEKALKKAKQIARRMKKQAKAGK